MTPWMELMAGAFASAGIQPQLEVRMFLGHNDNDETNEAILCFGPREEEHTSFVVPLAPGSASHAIIVRLAMLAVQLYTRVFEAGPSNQLVEITKDNIGQWLVASAP